MEEIAYLIPLTQGRHALVDEEDWELLRKHKWQAQWSPKAQTYYAQRGVRLDGRSMAESMHRRIMSLEFGDKRQVDHVSHNGLDNRRQNLRIVTLRQNQENRRDQGPHGPGVRSWGKRFQAQAYRAGKQHYLGTFATAEEAREARRRFLEGHDEP